MKTATYVCTALLGTNKTGKLTPDEKGYYTLVLGGLNVFNSAGAFYPFDTAKSLFEESSSLMRRIANGALRGEYGHPKKTPGMTMRDFIQRVLEIHEENVCCHIKEVSLMEDGVRGPNGHPIVKIIGKVKPMGPKGEFLRESLENPEENVCFSIRSLTLDCPVGGVIHKNLKTVVTWDLVNEPGISHAMKWQSPTLESISNDYYFTSEQIKTVVSAQSKTNFGLESGVSASEVINDFGWKLTDNNLAVPASSRW